MNENSSFGSSISHSRSGISVILKYPLASIITFTYVFLSVLGYLYGKELLSYYNVSLADFLEPSDYFILFLKAPIDEFGPTIFLSLSIFFSYLYFKGNLDDYKLDLVRKFKITPQAKFYSFAHYIPVLITLFFILQSFTIINSGLELRVGIFSKQNRYYFDAM